MKFSITLNTDKEVLYSIPGTKIFLTAGSPTTELELDNLDEAIKITLAGSIRINRISATTHPDTIAPVTMKAVTASQPQAKPTPPVAADTVAVRAKEILNSGLSAIKKEVLVTKELRLIKMMFALESGDKKRVAVLKLLKEKLDIEEKAVKSALNKPSAEIPIKDPLAVVYNGQTIKYDVVESDQEEITIKVK